MKSLLVTLFLCFSSSVLAQAEKQPWSFTSEQSSNPISGMDLSAKGASRQGLSEFVRGINEVQSAPAPQWMNEAATSFKNAVSPQTEADVDRIAAQAYEMHIFISTGMPEGVLRHLFAQALSDDKNKYRFVVRGFEPQKVGQLVTKLRMLLPDPYKDDLHVEIDPAAFKQYGVTAVPVYVAKHADKWFKLEGTQSLVAVSEAAKRGGQYSAGELYAIAEPDVLDVMQERAKNYDWEPVLARAQSRIAQNLKPDFDLPWANFDTAIRHVPVFTVPQDITSPSADGKGSVLLARAGQAINLLDHTKLQAPVLVFDITDPRQLQMIKRWLTRAEYKRADIFIVGSGVTPADNFDVVSISIAKELGRPVFPMLKRLSERFGLQAVPAIVVQEGQQLLVRHFKPKELVQ